MKAGRALGILLAAAVIGISVFVYLARQATTIESLARDAAYERLDERRDEFGDAEPMLRVDPAGRVSRTDTEPGDVRHTLRQIRILGYRSASDQLVTVDIPFWFFRLKRPAVRMMLQGTGFDARYLEVTAEELQRFGPGLVLDLTRPGGDRYLVWTE